MTSNCRRLPTQQTLSLFRGLTHLTRVTFLVMEGSREVLRLKVKSEEISVIAWITRSSGKVLFLAAPQEFEKNRPSLQTQVLVQILIRTVDSMGHLFQTTMNMRGLL